jgi:poly(3-hydroxyalkanoate) depolymerase
MFDAKEATAHGTGHATMSSTEPPAPEAPTPGDMTRVLSVYGQRIRAGVRPGDGSRVPLLLCGGLGASFEVLQPVVDALDPRLEVIRFDVPGVGGSPAGPAPYPFSALAWLADGMLACLGYPQVDVLGLSWGGGLAQQLAAQHPRRCRRLVLVSTGTGTLMVPGDPQLLPKLVTPRRFLDPEYAASIAGELYGGSSREDPGRVRRLIANQFLHTSRRGYLFQLTAGLGWTSLPWLRLVQQPTLVLGGDDDPIVPLANARLLGRLIPDSQVHVFRGGHVALLTDAPQLAPVIEEFLTAPDRRTPPTTG